MVDVVSSGRMPSGNMTFKVGEDTGSVAPEALEESLSEAKLKELKEIGGLPVNVLHMALGDKNLENIQSCTLKNLFEEEIKTEVHITSDGREVSKIPVEYTVTYKDGDQLKSCKFKSYIFTTVPYPIGIDKNSVKPEDKKVIDEFNRNISVLAIGARVQLREIFDSVGTQEGKEIKAKKINMKMVKVALENPIFAPRHIEEGELSALRAFMKRHSIFVLDGGKSEEGVKAGSKSVTETGKKVSFLIEGNYKYLVGGMDRETRPLKAVCEDNDKYILCKNTLGSIAQATTQENFGEKKRVVEEALVRIEKEGLKKLLLTKEMETAERGLERLKNSINEAEIAKIHVDDAKKALESANKELAEAEKAAVPAAAAPAAAAPAAAAAAPAAAAEHSPKEVAQKKLAGAQAALNEVKEKYKKLKEELKEVASNVKEASMEVQLVVEAGHFESERSKMTKLLKEVNSLLESSEKKTGENLSSVFLAPAAAVAVAVAPAAADPKAASQAPAAAGQPAAGQPPPPSS